jgi:hypothetical protein
MHGIHGVMNAKKQKFMGVGKEVGDIGVPR